MMQLNPSKFMTDLIDLNLCNARQLYLSKGDPSGVEGLI